MEGATALAPTTSPKSPATVPVSAPILVATDGSKDARVALAVGVDLARRSGSPLHLVHAWMEPVRYDYMYGMPTTLEFGDEAKVLLDGELGRAAKAGVEPAGSHLVSGRPGWTAETVAAGIRAGLLVVGSRGLGAIGRLLLGSVSGELVQHAPCPVLVCGAEPGSWPPHHLVVGDDFSDDAYSAALAAAPLARALDLPISLVHAIPSRYAHSDSPGSVRRRQDAERAAARALAGRARRLGAATGARLLTEVVVGDAAAELLARDGKYGMLAVGRRGRGLISRALLGSVSNKLLRAARGPVLVVPPDSHS